MLNQDAVERALSEAHLDQRWTESLETWSGATAAQRLAVLAYVRGLLNQVLHVVRVIDDSEDLTEALAYRYLELKCQWSTLNTLIQYRLYTHGEVNDALMYRASCVSMLIEELEPLLALDAIQDIATQLAAPLQRLQAE